MGGLPAALPDLVGGLPAALPDLVVSLTLALPRTFSVVAMAGVFRRGATK
jgi:hypothetical protein